MKQKIEKYLKQAILEVTKNENGRASSADKPDFDIPEIAMDRPKNEQFGDYTTNISMVLARSLKKSPMEIAKHIVTLLHCYIDNDSDTKKTFEKVEVVMPGYINFYLSKKYFQDKVAEINSEGNDFGNSGIGKNVKVNNEFISANPTGPLHLGNGRGGFYGDSLSRVLRKAGFEVTNEYYVNDAGEQVMRLGHSVLKDEEAAYKGDYIDELGKMFGDIGDVREIGEKAAVYIMDNIVKKTASGKMQISFDEWVSEKWLYDEGYVDRAIKILRDKKLTFEKDGALWLRTTDFGDDKDRVLVKSDRQKTYFASDCGYILNKIERGFDVLIEIWGADHHGYIQRFKAAAKALGFEEEKIHFEIVQLVRLMKDGKEVRMSKRAGNVVCIDDLIDEIGHDVTRFFFLMYSPDTHMNFDLGLAKERSQKNPVFYVQYAHARICSILDKFQMTNIPPRLAETTACRREADKFQTNDKFQIPNLKNADLSLLIHEKELSLIKELEKLPELVEEIASSYEVHKLPHYAVKLADKFHSFYDKCRVIDEENEELTKARLFLTGATRIVLAETLRLIGVNAPEKM